MISYDQNAGKPRFTKGDVRRAGEKLRAFVQGQSIEHEDLVEAVKIADGWRQLHWYPLNTFQPLLRLKLKKADVKSPQVAQRLKKMPTIIGKLSRITGSLDSMQDIAGIRIVFKTLSDLRKFEKELINSRFKHTLKNSKDYIGEPKPDGYRGVHVIYRCHSLSKDAPEHAQGLMIELQLRTQLQHYWATAVEAVDIFYGQSLKFGEGEAKWRQFFALVSAALAHEEKTKSPAEYSALSKIEVIEELRVLEKDLNAIHKLTAISRLTGSLSAAEKKSTKLKFYLLMLARDSETGQLSFKYMTFKENEEDQANIWYKNLEEGKEASSSLDVVLVRTTGKQLALLYSNYFLDVSEFLKVLKKLLF